jgi:hypothetical protein
MVLFISWKNPEGQGKQDVLYYTIEKKEDSQTASWGLLTDHKIEPEEASYLSKCKTSFKETFSREKFVKSAYTGLAFAAIK